MFCPECGSQNDDYTKYCTNCGALLPQQAGSSMRNNGNHNNYGNYRNESPYGRMQIRPIQVDGNAENSLRNLVLSPIFLTAVIALTVQIVLGILASVRGSSYYADLINRILSESDLYYYDSSIYYTALSAVNSTNALAAVFTSIPAILIAAGLWVEYVSARNSMQRMTTTGFTMVRVIMIIRLVLVILAIAFLVLLTVIGCIALSNFSDGWGIVLVLSIFTIAIVGALNILYYYKVIKMIGSANNIILFGSKTGQASLYVLVFTIISAGINAIITFTSLVSLNIFGVLSSAAAAAAAVAFVMLMLRYNNMSDSAYY